MSTVTLGTIKAGLGEDGTVKVDDKLQVNEETTLKKDLIFNGGTFRRNIVMAKKTDIFTDSSGDFVDITDMSITITISTNGRVLIQGYGVFGNSTNTSRAYIRLIRVGADVNLFTGAENGTFVRTTMSCRPGDSIANHQNGSFIFLDEPGAGTHTYKLQISNNGIGTAVIGTSGYYATGGTACPSVPTVLIAEEV